MIYNTKRKRDESNKSKLHEEVDSSYHTTPAATVNKMVKISSCTNRDDLPETLGST